MACLYLEGPCLKIGGASTDGTRRRRRGDEPNVEMHSPIGVESPRGEACRTSTDQNGRKTHVKRSPDTHERHMPNGPDEQPTNAAPDESDIDQILADSFPASDAPPWTLGVAPAPDRKGRTRKRHRGDR